MALNFVSRSMAKSSEWLSGSVYDRIVQVVVYLAVFLAPLWYLPITSSILELNKQFLIVALAAIALMVWLVGVVVSGKLMLRTTPVDKGILALAGASIVATIFSRMPGRSFFGADGFVSSALLSLLALAVFYFLVVNVVPGRGRPVRFFLSLSLLVTLLVGVLQIFGIHILPGVFTQTREFTTAGIPNALGMIAALCLPFFAKTVSLGSGRLSMGMSVLGVALSMVVLAALNWWVLWVVALVGMLVMIALDSINLGILAEEAGQGGRSALVRLLVPMLVVVFGISFLLVRPTSLKEKLPVELIPSYALTWDTIVGVMKEWLPTGYGPENFSIAFDQFAARRLGNTTHADARVHDGTGEAFTFVAQTGAVGIVALGVMLWCLIQVFQKFGTAIAESRARGEGIVFVRENSATLAALVGMTVGLFLYPFNMALMTIWFVLLALAGTSVTDPTARAVHIEERPTASLLTSLGFMAGLTLALVTAYLFTNRYLADIHYAHAFHQTTATAALDDLMRAVDLNSRSDRYLRTTSQVMLSAAQEEIKRGSAADSKKIQDLIGSAIASGQRATDIAPTESLNWENLGRLYQALVGVVDDVETLSEDAFQKAAEVRPGDPTFDNAAGQLWLTYGEFLRTTGQPMGEALTRAEKAFQRALRISPSFGSAIYNLGTVYERQGKIREAIVQLEKIIPGNINQPEFLFELGLLYIRAGQRADARAAMQRTILLVPSHANARWYLALLLEEQGDIEGALLQLNEIRKTNSDNAILLQKIQQLEAGRRAIPPGKVIDNMPIQ